MPGSYESLFADLGILADRPETNPYEALGLSSSYAQHLLRQDLSGQALQDFARTARKVVLRLHHTDPNARLPDADRFRQAEEAYERIKSASRETLLRWTQVAGTSSSSASNSRAAERGRLVAERAAHLVEANMQLGQHPSHFSQFQWSQGILTKRSSGTFLLRSIGGGEIETRRGERVEPVAAQRRDSRTPPRPSTRSQRTLDFQEFLQRHRLFGLEPGSAIQTYITEDGQASILQPDLSFIMDITHPFQKYRKKRRRNPSSDPSDFWARSANPLLLTTTVPDRTIRGLPKMDLIHFPETVGPAGAESAQRVNRMPMTVAGTTATPEFYRRVRHNKKIGAAALQGIGTRTAQIGMISLPASQLIEQDAGYSPLIAPGADLLLYHPETRSPVVTDARVIGMIAAGAMA